MSVGLYRAIMDAEVARFKKGLGCYRYRTDEYSNWKEANEERYISDYFESKPQKYSLDEAEVDLPPKVAFDDAASASPAAKISFKSKRKGYGPSRFLRLKGH